MKPLRKRSEVTQRLEGKAKLLNLRLQATEKLVSPSREVWIISEQYLHTHGWWRQSSLLEDPAKSESYFCVGPGALEGLVD